MAVILDTAPTAVPFVLAGPPGLSIQGPPGPASTVPGPQGAPGQNGYNGKDGIGIRPKGSFATFADLPSTAAAGDTYLASMDDTSSPKRFVSGDGLVWTGAGNDLGPGGNYHNVGPVRGPPGTTTVDGLTDASTTGKAIAKGDPVQGRAALGLAQVAASGAATDVAYAQAGSGAVNLAVQEVLRGLAVVPEMYADADTGNGNDTAAAQRAIDLGNRRVLFLDRTYDLTKLVFPNGHPGFYGLSDRCQLLFGANNNANPADDLITFGDGTAENWNIRIDDIKLQTRAPKTGGATLRLNKVRQAILRGVLIGDKKDLYNGLPPRLYDGIVGVNTDSGLCDGVHISGLLRNAMTLAGPVYSAEWTWAGGGQILQCGGIAYYLGGNVGGFKLLSGGAALCDHGLYMDTAQASGIPNREVFIASNFSIDSCVNRGVYAGPSSIGIFQADTLWLASHGKNALGNPISGALGIGIEIAPGQVSGATFDIGRLIGYNCSKTAAIFSGGTVSVGGGEVWNNGENGVALAAGIDDVQLANLRSTYNTGYGVYADPALISAAKAGTKGVELIGVRSYGNTAGQHFGFGGAVPNNRYSVVGGYGIPTS